MSPVRWLPLLAILCAAGRASAAPHLLLTPLAADDWSTGLGTGGATAGGLALTPPPPRPPGKGWLLAGAVGAVPLGLDAGAIGGAAAGLGLSLAFAKPGSSTPPNTTATNVALYGLTITGALAGGIAAGFGGYLLGKLARDGSGAAKVGVVILDVLGGTAVLATGLGILAGAALSGCACG